MTAPSLPLDSSVAFNEIYGAAPDLYSTPSLVPVAASSPDPAGTAEAVSHVQNQVATAQTAQHHGFFGGLLHDVSPVLKVLNKPLGAVQHEYRYLRDVAARHGPAAALSEGLSMLVVGGVAGFFGGPEAGILAAEAVGRVEGQFLFKDSWGRTQDGATYRLNGSAVSPGRDLAHLFGLHDTGSGAGKYVSGIADAGFDLTADPLIVAGKLSATTRSARGLTDTLAYKSGVARGFVDRFAPGMAPRYGTQGVADADKAWLAYPRYRRAAGQIGDHALNDKGFTGWLTDNYSELRGVAPQIKAGVLASKAATPGERFHEFVRGAYADGEMADRMLTGTLPSRSLMRVPFNAANEFVRQFGSHAGEEDLATVGVKSGDLATQQGLSRVNPLRAIPRAVRTFTGYMPFSIDKETGALSRKTFDPEDNASLQGIYRSMRFSMGTARAREYTDMWANSSLAERKRLWGEIQVETIKAAGLEGDESLMKEVTDYARRLNAGDDRAEAYGAGWKHGDDINNVQDPSGTQRLGLYEDQTGRLAFPDYEKLRQAVRNMNGVNRVYGGVEQQMYHRYLSNFFKPLALLNTGFGLRVAFAEAIPATFRYGLINVLKSRIDVTTAKHRFNKLGDDERQHLMSTMMHVAGGPEALNDLSAKDTDLMIRMLLQNNGHMVRGVGDAGHNSYFTPDEPQEKINGLFHFLGQQKQSRLKFGQLGDYKLLRTTDADSANSVTLWHTNLVKARDRASARLIARDLSDAYGVGMKEKDALAYARRQEHARIKQVDPETGAAVDAADDPYHYERKRLARYVAQSPAEFSAHRVDDVANLLHSADGKFHGDIADMLAERDTVPRKLLKAKADDTEDLAIPEYMVGRQKVPYMGDSLFSRVISEGFQRTVDPVINYVSREPIYFQAVKNEYRAFEDAVRSGEMTEDQALRLAQNRATHAILPQIHNTALRSQFSQMARSFIPFYFAQEQALRRGAHLISRHPNAFRQYQLIEQSLNDPAFVQKDKYGNKHLMFPIVGEFGKGGMLAAQAAGIPVKTGLPLTFSGDLTSLQTVLPEAKPPGVSPFGAVPMDWLTEQFPELAGVEKALVGERGFHQSHLNDLIPNTALRNILLGVQGDERNRSMATAMMSAYAAAYYHGKVPKAGASPGEWAAFNASIRNNARSMMIMKGVLGFFSPLTPSVSADDVNVRADFQKYLDKYGDYPTAVHHFIGKFGNKAISYTISRTANPSGAYVPTTKAAVDFLHSQAGLIRSHPNGAAYLIPQANSNDGDFQVLQYELLNSHLREHLTPEQFMNQILIQQGSARFFAEKKVVDDALTKNTGNTAETGRISQLWAEEQQKMAIHNPVWADDFYSQSRINRAARIYADLTGIFGQGKAPAGEQTDLVRGLMNDFTDYSVMLGSLGVARAQSSQRAQLRQQWSDYLDGLRKQDPRLQSIIDNVFVRLDPHVNQAVQAA